MADGRALTDPDLPAPHGRHEGDGAGGPKPLHDTGFRGFSSDNASGVHPEVLAAVAAANGGHVTAYGEDPYTARLQELVREHFGPQAEAFPVFNGTGANVVSLQSLTQRWQSVICARTAHITVDECAAPEKVGGLKLLTIHTPDGKLTPELVDLEAFGLDDVHRAQPRVVSVTQSTELGTVYTPDELRALANHVHARGLLLHVDGARISNAVAALGCSLREVTTDAGVDVLSYGGTKNGALGGEAVVVLNPDAVVHADAAAYLRKSSMQLSSKMRFVSAQLVALLEDGLWLRSAQHANAMAARLAEAVRGVEGVTITQPTQANAVFAVLAPQVTERLQQRAYFYTWSQATGEVRWMTTFDTTEADVDAFAAMVAEEAARG